VGKYQLLGDFKNLTMMLTLPSIGTDTNLDNWAGSLSVLKEKISFESALLHVFAMGQYHMHLGDTAKSLFATGRRR
jgi:hypothetical protein